MMLSLANNLRIVQYGSSWRRVGEGSFNNIGRGGDARFGDFVGRDPVFPPPTQRLVPWWLPRLRGLEEISRASLGLSDPRETYLRLRSMSTSGVEEVLRRWFRDPPLSTGTDGQAAIDRFMSGRSGNHEYLPGTAVSNEFKATNTYRDSFETVATSLKHQLAVQARRGEIDPGRLHVSHDVPFRTTSRDITYGPKLRALFGGIQANEFYIRNFRSRRVTAQLGGRSMTFDYSAEVRFVLYDEFGVDESDLYQEGLIALWILQHQRSGRPFVMKVAIDNLLYGNY